MSFLVVSQVRSEQSGAVQRLGDPAALQLPLSSASDGEEETGSGNTRHLKSPLKDCTRRLEAIPAKGSLGLSDNNDILDESYQSAKLKTIYF